ncbi:hypothetical protein BC941DRAFT_457163 [Chlamydoabsidia padenii]|nr:hypothetical protein BC941DRAFT_457163 [Chlamydoabsidia padenii]
MEQHFIEAATPTKIHAPFDSEHPIVDKRTTERRKSSLVIGSSQIPSRDRSDRNGQNSVSKMTTPINHNQDKGQDTNSVTESARNLLARVRQNRVENRPEEECGTRQRNALQSDHHKKKNRFYRHQANKKRQGAWVIMWLRNPH